jgi:hypothetical protein
MKGFVIKFMQQIDLSIPKGAIFSDDGKFRYALWRVCKDMFSTSRNLKIRLQISLNPSTAGKLNDDPTISRSVVRAVKDGFGVFMQGNLSAYISTDPKIFLREGCQIGLETDDYLRQMISLALLSGGQVVCAWGSFLGISERAKEVLKMIPEPYCLGVNPDGNPKHPLYIGYNIPMVRYQPIKI